MLMGTAPSHAVPHLLLPGQPPGTSAPTHPPCPSPQGDPYSLSPTDWVTLNNTSFSRQPRCAEGRPGSRRCSCDTGFQMRAGGTCQGKRGVKMVARGENRGSVAMGLLAMPHALPPDVDECQLFQSNPQTRLCLHDCLNFPGSYRCLCPPGYLLHADGSSCEGKSGGLQGREHPVGPGS